ncbi:flavin reductase family protein [Microbacterium sp. A588]
MARVPTSVAVVTTDADGKPYGTTVSAFMSLSMHPPTVLVSLANKSSLLAKLRPATIVGINVLSVDQADVAAFFAREDKRGVSVAWELGDDEPPRLSGAHAWFAAIVTELIQFHRPVQMSLLSLTRRERRLESLVIRLLGERSSR